MPRLFRVGVIAVLLLAGHRDLQAQHIVTENEVSDAVRSANLELLSNRTSAAAEALRPRQVTWPFPMVETELMPNMIIDGQTGVAVMARQPLPRPGLLSAERDARQRMAEASELETEAITRERVMQVRMAYATLWGLQEQVARLDSFQTRTRLYEEVALAQYAAGRGQQQAALRVQMEYEMLSQRIEAFREDASSLRRRIELLTGGRVDMTSSTRLAPPPLPSSAQEVDAGAIADHPMVEAGRAMRESEEAMVDVRRAEGRPELSVGLAIDLSPMARERMFGREPVMPSVGVVLPLWREGIRAGVEEARLRVRQRELEADHAELSLETERRDVVQQIRQVASRITRYEHELQPRVELTREATTSAYRAGRSPLIDVLDVERTSLDIELDLLNARVRAAGLFARLRYLTGE